MLLFSASFASADEFSIRSIAFPPDASMIIKGFQVGSEYYDVFLDRYENPADPDGFYWKYSDAELTFSERTVHVLSDIVYENMEPIDRHQLDIYYPDNPENDKVIFFVPGGAWRQGDKNLYGELGRTLAGFYSFTVVVVNYRLSNDEDGNAVHPDHINDVAHAFQWVKSNIAPYGCPDKIYLFGQSAGGHLVSLLATDPQYLAAVGCSVADIRAVLSMSGAYDLPDMVTYPDNPLGLTADEVLMYKKIMQDAFGGWSDAFLSDPSPDRHIHSGQPPFLVVYTYNDLAGFHQEAENFALSVQQLDPPPEIALRGIERSDYSDIVWSTAADMASSQTGMSEYVGHYAEVVAINTNEPNGYITRMVVDFFLRH